MIKQTLMITTPAVLTLKNLQMQISMPDGNLLASRPIEDIGFVLIENQMVKMSIPLLNELSENNVGVIFCDGKAMPKSMLMNLDANSTLQESYKYQIEASQPIKKQIWKQIIEAKIRNQANLLDKCEKNGNILKPYYMNVKSGDSDNREGIAAKMYWKTLMGNDFLRAREGPPPNNFLNYGYSILRSAVARALMGSGLFPAFGIFHKNRYNAFPLADDVMEPYRPFVDEIAFSLYEMNGEIDLTKENKQELLRILFVDTYIGKITRPLEVSLSLTTASLLKVLKGESKNLVYPMLK